MIVYVLIALLCSAANCTPMPGSKPVTFRTERECRAFAIEASKQGMAYACERQDAI
jgi:hypothetical protein